MRSVEDYGVSVEFQKRLSTSHHRTPLGKPTPSKWDDAQKWLVNLSGPGDRNNVKASPRNSNADDRRLISMVPKDYWSGEEEEDNGCCPGSSTDEETKDVDWAELAWTGNKQDKGPDPESICLRDTGTEMTPVASQEPSRSATPVRGAGAVSRSHKSSRSSTPVRCLNGQMAVESGPSLAAGRSGSDGDTGQLKREEANAVNESKLGGDGCKKMNPSLETRAAAWDEAERTKYMARYKREELKIQAWENNEKRKAEMEYGQAEAKAERVRARAQEEYGKKLAETQRIAEEMRANAEAKVMMRSTTTSTSQSSQHARLPSSSFPSFKLSSWCYCC